MFITEEHLCGIYHSCRCICYWFSCLH